MKICRQRVQIHEKGFTIIELIVVVVIIGILVAFGIPRALNLTGRARENTLRGNLRMLRGAIERYYTTTEAFPADLPALVTDGYMKEIPNDPYTTDDADDSSDYTYDNTTGNVNANSAGHTTW